MFLGLGGRARATVAANAIVMAPGLNFTSSCSAAAAPSAAGTQNGRVSRSTAGRSIGADQRMSAAVASSQTLNTCVVTNANAAVKANATMGGSHSRSRLQTSR
jgi:hypothetical protein